MEQLKEGCSDSSESDILHTLRWSSRLRVPTYVNWIKVRPRPPLLLGGPLPEMCNVQVREGV